MFSAVMLAIVMADTSTLKAAAAAHRIEFGTCVAPSQLTGPLADIIKAEYSVVEPENASKFGPIHPEPDRYDFSGADAIVAFARENGMKARGHTLVWHNQNASWVTAPGMTPEKLRAAMEDHISTVMKHYAGKMYAWDVVNEAFNDDGTLRKTVWFNNPGIGMADKGSAYIEHAFRLARKADPKAQLYYNDYGAETLGKKADGIYEMCKDFKARGVPIDGIGFQAHLIMQMNNQGALDSIEKNFQRFADLGLDIEITELDIRLSDGSPASLAAQADFYGKFVALCRRQPRCRLIQTWGVSDRHSWIPGTFRGMGWALLWDENYQKKPAYDAVLKALAEKS